MSSSVESVARAVADRYRIERDIGEGGMARVYLAHDARHDRHVAIKVLHPELAAALGGDRFLAEIKTTAKLQHPHILPLLDSGSADGVLYYVMPFVRGETLRARLERERLLPIDDALRIGREVADALNHAHQLGIIHRDIKPENILIQDGHALVADFGIALAVQHAGGARMTQTGLSLGTPQYMSPEQAMGEKSIDARSDQYALGAVMYEMLVGDPPFTGSTVQGIVAKVMTEKPTRIVTQRDRVPLNVEAAILRALEKLPADRWPSVSAFVDGLNAAAVTYETASSPRTDRRRTPIALLAAAAVCALGGGIGWFAAHSSATPATATTVTSILPPTSGNFSEQRSLALSPDGRKLAFVFAGNDGSRSLWLREMDKLDPTQIKKSDGAEIPFWSPDGKSLAFFVGGFLQVVDANGDIRRLCAAPTPTAGSWSAQGLIVFSSHDGVGSVAAENGTCRKVMPGNAFQPRAVLWPDGKHIIYQPGRFAPIAILDLDGKTLGTLPINPITFDVAAPDYIVSPNSGDITAMDIQRVDVGAAKLLGTASRLANGVRTGAGIPTIAIGAGDALAYLPGTGDKPYLLYDKSGQVVDTVRIEGTWTVSARPRGAGPPLVAVAGRTKGLWLYEIESGRASKISAHDTSVEVGIEGIVGFTAPVFSHDGTRLAFATLGKNRCGLSELRLGSTEARSIMSVPVSVGYECPATLDWSSDGTRLLVRTDTALAIMALDGKVISRIARPGIIWDGHFSPDGSTVVFSSDETSRIEVYIQTLPTGQPNRISLEGGRWPAFTSDGHHVVYMSPSGTIFEASVNGVTASGKPRTILTAPSWRRSTFHDRGVGFAMLGDEERFVVRQSPSGQAVTYVQHWRSPLR